MDSIEEDLGEWLSHEHTRKVLGEAMATHRSLFWALMAECQRTTDPNVSAAYVRCASSGAVVELLKKGKLGTFDTVREE